MQIGLESLAHLNLHHTTCMLYVHASNLSLDPSLNCVPLLTVMTSKKERAGGLAFSITFESMKLYERICHIFRKNVLLLIPHKYSSPPTLQTIMFKNIKDDRGIPYI